MQANFGLLGDLQSSNKELDRAKVQELIKTIEDINAWLQTEYWPSEKGIKEDGQWIVGEEKGLEYRKGALWYGNGGETVDDI